jgi:hypothetical protein
MTQLGSDGTKFQDVVCEYLGCRRAQLGAPYDFSKNGKTFQCKYSKRYVVHPKEVRAGRRKKTYRWVWQDIYGDSGSNTYDYLLLCGLQQELKAPLAVDDCTFFLIPFAEIKEKHNRPRIEIGVESNDQCKPLTRLVLSKKLEAANLRAWVQGLNGNESNEEPKPHKNSQSGFSFG